MDKDQALREVHEIKQVMDDSRRKSNRGYLWGGIAFIVAALVLSGIFPFLGPVLAVGLLAGGIITYRKTNDRLVRGIAGGAIAVGGIMLVAILLVLAGNYYYRG